MDGWQRNGRINGRTDGRADGRINGRRMAGSTAGLTHRGRHSPRGHFTVTAKLFTFPSLVYFSDFASGGRLCTRELFSAAF